MTVLFFPAWVFLSLFNWRIIALQYCVGLCHTTAWISHRYTCVCSPLEPLSHLLPHPTHSRLSQSTGLSSLGHTANSHWLFISYKPLSHLLPHPTHCRLSQSTGLSSLGHTANSHWLFISYICLGTFKQSIFVAQLTRECSTKAA